LLVDVFDLAGEVFHGAFLELRHTHPGVAGLDYFALDRLCLDFFAHDGHRESPVFVLAEDGQHHLGPGLTAHALDRLVQAQSLDGGVVDLGDQVVGLESGPIGGRAFNRRDHFDQSVFLGDLDAHPDKFASGAFRKFLETLLVEILRVWVQAGHHARNGLGDQFFLVDRLHIVALDHAEDGRQLLQFFKWQRRHVATCHGLQRHGRQCAGQCTCTDPADDLEFLSHLAHLKVLP